MPEKLTTTEWADRHRYLSAKASALPGKYRSSVTPYIVGIHEALDDPLVHTVVGRKSAQIAWTDGAMNNYIGKLIDIDPKPVIVMFPKEQAAREYDAEKFKPMVESTPRLSAKVDISSSRKAENRQNFKNFPGGFLKLVGSGSPASVKSTPAPVVIIEEPDDCVSNLRGQGDTIALLVERAKTFPQRKIVYGGTPTVAGLSTVDTAYQGSDQRQYWVPCHHCDESHVLEWGNVHWDADPEQTHEIFGQDLPATAWYACPHCGGIWDDHHKNQNVRRGDWRASKPFNGVAGFAINELMSPFPGSVFSVLVARFLEATKEADQGDDEKLIVFTNSCLGLPYEFGGKGADADTLAEQAQDYDELTVPRGGLVITAGVDIQHDRIAIIMRAWGRGDESWLVYWGEIYGNTIDKTDPVWGELDSLLFQPIKSAAGVDMQARAVSIDCSDGTTSDAVYSWVRTRLKRGVMAVKGSSNDTGNREIFSKPRPIETTGKRNTKASKYGLGVYIVGTHRGKDLVTGRMALTGSGPGRMHTYAGVRDDYWDQITAEVKAPASKRGSKPVWQLKAGRHNEAFDCEVYATHAAKSLRLHLLKPHQWDELEHKLNQPGLFAEAEPPADQPTPPDQPATTSTPTDPATRRVFNARKSRPTRRPGGWVNSWKA